jgi:hypothetical protein
VKYLFVILVFAIIAGVSAWNLWPDTPLPSGTKADLVVVHKEARRLELYRGNELLRAYHVSLGRHSIGSISKCGSRRIGHDPWDEERIWMDRAASPCDRLD